MIETDFKVVEEEEIIDEVEETIVPTRQDIVPKRQGEVPSNPDPARDSQNPLDLFLDDSLDSPLDGAGGGEIQVNQQEEIAVAAAPTDRAFAC